MNRPIIIPKRQQTNRPKLSTRTNIPVRRPAWNQTRIARPKTSAR